MTNKTPKHTWDDFCSWLLDDMHLSDKIPIEWCIIKQDGFDPLIGDSIVRINLFPGKPYQVTIGIANKYRFINHDLAFYVSRRLIFVIRDAIKSNSPMFYIPYTQF